MILWKSHLDCCYFDVTHFSLFVANVENSTKRKK